MDAVRGGRGGGLVVVRYIAAHVCCTLTRQLKCRRNSRGGSPRTIQSRAMCKQRAPARARSKLPVSLRCEFSPSKYWDSATTTHWRESTHTLLNNRRWSWCSVCVVCVPSYARLQLLFARQHVSGVAAPGGGQHTQQTRDECGMAEKNRRQPDVCARRCWWGRYQRG